MKRVAQAFRLQLTEPTLLTLLHRGLWADTKMLCTEHSPISVGSRYPRYIGPVGSRRFQNGFQMITVVHNAFGLDSILGNQECVRRTPNSVASLHFATWIAQKHEPGGKPPQDLILFMGTLRDNGQLYFPGSILVDPGSCTNYVTANPAHSVH